MGMTSEQYRDQLLALQPPGVGLPSDPGSTWALLMRALSDEFERLDGRAEDLIQETDPRTTYQLLLDWEQLVGIPTSCSGRGQTLALRREELHVALTATGGQSIAYFIGVAERLGFTGGEILEYTPHSVDLSVDAPVYGKSWALAWTFSAATPSIKQLTVDGAVDELLGEQSPTTRLECIFEKLKPIHTTVLFNYT